MQNTPVLFAADIPIWAAQVASQANFPDERLNTRFQNILATFASKPHDSIPQANGSAGQAKGTYRFLSNPRLEPDDLLQPLVDTTLDSLRGLPTILVVQDTSSLNYSSLEHTTGLGPLNDSPYARGLHLHTTLAVRPDGVVIGLLHQDCWARPVDQPLAAERRSLPIEDKESYKWLEGIRAAEAALDNLPAPERPRLIHVMDREGDIHEVLAEIAGSPHGAVIRCAQNRKVAGPDYAHRAVAAAPLLAEITLDLPASRGCQARQARVELRTTTVTITPNPSKYPQRQPVTFNLVEVREIDAPADVAEPIHWLLWTTEPAGTLAEVLALVSIYKLRWRVEDFHLTLKSGCQIEKLALETAARLEKAILLYSAVAIRIVGLRDLARVEPHAPCTAIMSNAAWQALYTHINQCQPTSSTTLPTVQQVVLWIGRLGGHLGRKRDGMPGVRTLWRGWRDLSLLTAGWRAAQAYR